MCCFFIYIFIKINESKEQFGTNNGEVRPGYVDAPPRGTDEGQSYVNDDPRLMSAAFEGGIAIAANEDNMFSAVFERPGDLMLEAIAAPQLPVPNEGDADRLQQLLEPSRGNFGELANDPRNNIFFSCVF